MPTLQTRNILHTKLEYCKYFSIAAVHLEIHSEEKLYHGTELLIRYPPTPPQKKNNKKNKNKKI